MANPDIRLEDLEDVSQSEAYQASVALASSISLPTASSPRLFAHHQPNNIAPRCNPFALYMPCRTHICMENSF